MTDIRIYGIRHHGPGSARSLQAELTRFQPDCVLIEGPPDADGIIPLASDPAMRPPVALLVYKEDEPGRSGFFPFAAFSPEWVAMRFASANNAACRFIDLPQSLQLCFPTSENDVMPIPRDPLQEMAELDGSNDGERWWDDAVESRAGDPGAVFEALADMMSALRENEGEIAPVEAAREAHMRTAIRAASGNFTRIAVVCGAWHVPALLKHGDKGQASFDAGLLRGLPKVKTACAWVPWSYEKLASSSGYSAGVTSPEWYHALWEHGDQLAARWLSTAAHLLRARDLDASPASVIQAVRLAEGLAWMRERSRPNLDDLTEAALSALCQAESAPMLAIHRKLVVGERLGAVPENAPTTPLQADFNGTCKRLKLLIDGGDRQVEFDLRKDIDLQRSQFLHRIGLLDIPWANRDSNAKSTGTFRERWHLSWKPEFVISLVSASKYGSTVVEAATEMSIKRAEESQGITKISEMIGDLFDANLPKAVQSISHLLSDRAAVATDVFDLMSALPPLAQLARYGSVRSIDTTMVVDVLNGIVPRVAAGLPAACHSLDDDAAAKATVSIGNAHQAIMLLENQDMKSLWLTALGHIATTESIHGRVGGKANRILFDIGEIDAQEAGIRLRLAMSRSGDGLAAATWAEGFFESSGAVLIHGSSLLPVVDQWLTELLPEHFMSVLPVLRRTFANFSKAERHDIGERLRKMTPMPAASVVNAIPAATAKSDVVVSYERAERVVPTLRLILGVAA